MCWRIAPSAKSFGLKFLDKVISRQSVKGKDIEGFAT